MKPSIEPILDTDLRDMMFGRTGLWLREWLETVTVEDMLQGGESDADRLSASPA
jgi:hypothetical protein